MRKAIGWTLSWALFWIGHWISIPLNSAFVGRLSEDDFDRIYWAYCVYSRIMVASTRIQDWGGIAPEFGPWSPVIKGEE